MEENKNKKPIYKNWWFWLLAILFIGVIMPNDELESNIDAEHSDAINSSEDDINKVEDISETTLFTEKDINKVEVIENNINESQQEVSSPKVTLGQKNALAKAKSYLNYTAFSYQGLIEQLEYEGFTSDEATYGVDNCQANWNEQAAKKAESYLNYTSFSRQGLIEQLEYEGFTHEQAIYGVEAIGY